LDGPDPEGHWLGMHLADGLAQQLGAGVPFEWHGSDGADGVGAGAGAGSTVVPGTRHVAGALLLVTRGRFGFLGGSDKERQVMCLALAHAKGALSPLHWLAPAPDEAKSSSRSGGSSSSRMNLSSGEERAQPGFLALRVKKDELRTAVVAVSANAFASSSSEAANACVLSLDAESAEVPKRGSGLVSAGSYDRPAAFPLTLTQAVRVEGEENKAASLLALRPSERKAWASALRAAFPALFINGNNSSSGNSSSSRNGGPSSDKAELFGGSNRGSGATPAPASSAAAARAGATGAEDAANEAIKGLQERGEKLSQLAEKTQMLEDSASEFEKMCKDLEKQQRGRWF